MGVVECKLCKEYGVECQDFRKLPFFIKQRAVFVRGVNTHTGVPISKCAAVVNKSKIATLAEQIVYEAGEIPEMYTEDYDRGN